MGQIVPKANTQARAPRLTESARRLLADPFRMEGEGHRDWEPPEVPPESVKLRAWAQELETCLKPATPGHMQWCVGKLMVLPSRSGDFATSAVQADNFIDACGHFPDDLWSTATLKLLQTKRFRPTPAEVVELIGPDFVVRQRMLDRTNTMLGAEPSKAIPAQPKFVATAARDRLRKILAEQQTRDYADESHRVHAMAHTERALAFEERRPMADWAQQFFDGRLAADGQPTSSLGQHAKAVVGHRSPSTLRVTELAAARREGRPPADPNDPPPPGPDDIVVGDEFERGEADAYAEA